jgi:hypothetical protein
VISDTIEIARTPEEVYADLDALDRHREWQPEIVTTTVETDSPARETIPQDHQCLKQRLEAGA